MQTTTAEKTETLPSTPNQERTNQMTYEETLMTISRLTKKTRPFPKKMKSGVKWAYRKGKWVTKLFGVLYWVKAYKKDLWHISDTLVNDIRNRDTYPNRYAKWTYCQNLKRGITK